MRQDTLRHCGRSGITDVFLNAKFSNLFPFANVLVTDNQFHSYIGYLQFVFHTNAIHN